MYSLNFGIAKNQNSIIIPSRKIKNRLGGARGEGRRGGGEEGEGRGGGEEGEGEGGGEEGEGRGGGEEGAAHSNISTHLHIHAMHEHWKEVTLNFLHSTSLSP